MSEREDQIVTDCLVRVDEWNASDRRANKDELDSRGGA